MSSREILNNLYRPKKEESKPTPNVPTVYRKGQKPQWVEQEDESEDDIYPGEKDFDEMNEHKRIDNQKFIEIEKDDKRLKRLTDNNRKDHERIQVKAKREIKRTEIIGGSNTNKHNNVSVGKTEEMNKQVEIVDIASRREMMKRKLLENKEDQLIKNKEDEDELLELIGNDEDNDSKNNEDFERNNNVTDEDQSSDLEENEESDYNNEVLLRPVFVSKEERTTINEELKRELEEKELLEQQERLKELKKKQTKEIVKKYIEDEENQKKTEAKEDSEETEMPDDTDDLDNLVEYEQWKLRELRRIKIQFEEDEKKLKEKLDIERRRNLTDEQRKEENLRLGSDDTLRTFKSKINFLAKYYHKGAFYQSEAKEDINHVFNRDYNMPTAADKVDRSVMPKSLQVRRGLEHKKGRSKYTHLTAEDTTNFDPNYKIADDITNKFMSNLGGYKAQNDFDLTKKKRKNI